MAKRTSTQIEKDYKKIKKLATEATNFKEIQEQTGLSFAEILVSLKNHPRVHENIKKQLEENRAKKSVRGKDIKNICNEKNVVIDASIMSTPDIAEILKAQKGKIILTSVTVKELAQMQHFKDKDAMNARHILLMAAEDDDKFVHELINENLSTSDECILDYCVKNKEEVVLYTSDKEMYNFAKIYGVEARFFKAPVQKNKTAFITFYGVERIGSDLIIDLDFTNTKRKMLRVLSGDNQYDEGIVKLKIGDELLLASKRNEGHVAFAHYRITSLWKEQNAILIFSKRLYDMNKLDFDHKYKSFLRDFNRKMA